MDFDNPDKVVDYGQTGRVMLTTLTKEFFMPRFLERDEGEREPPYEKYPWDGVSGVRPFHGLRGHDDGGRVLMKVREMLKRLDADGWRLVRQKGSHRHFQHDQKSGTVTVPGKPSDELHPKTASSILRQAQLK